MTLNGGYCDCWGSCSCIEQVLTRLAPPAVPEEPQLCAYQREFRTKQLLREAANAVADQKWPDVHRLMREAGRLVPDDRLVELVNELGLDLGALRQRDLVPSS
jgi:hypothetical protein